MKPKPEKLYTSKQLREAAAAEIINCMGLAKDSTHPAIREYGRTLVVRIPAILDADKDPPPPNPQFARNVSRRGVRARANRSARRAVAGAGGGEMKQGEFTVDGIVAMRDKQPYLRLFIDGKQVGQVTMAAARSTKKRSKARSATRTRARRFRLR